jgi:integrase
MGTALARRKAKEKLGLVATGLDPHQEDQMSVKEGTFAEWSKYYTDRLPKSKSIRFEKTTHKIHLVPGLGKLLIKDIIEDDIQNLLNNYDSPSTHNKVKAYACKFFNWAIRNRRLTGVTFNPTTGIKQKEPNIRKFSLTKIQLQKFSKVLEKYRKDKPIDVYFIGLMLMIGCRNSELYSRRWGDVSFETSEFVNIPTKTGEKSIQLSQHALELLKQLYKITGKGLFLFPSPDKPNTHKVNFRAFWGICKEEAGLPEATQIRDLRTNYGSALLNDGVEVATVSSLMNHKSITTTVKHYAHILKSTERKALQKHSRVLKVM